MKPRIIHCKCGKTLIYDVLKDEWRCTACGVVKVK